MRAEQMFIQPKTKAFFDRLTQLGRIFGRRIFDLRSSLLPLGIIKVNFILLSLNRSLPPSDFHYSGYAALGIPKGDACGSKRSKNLLPLEKH